MNTTVYQIIKIDQGPNEQTAVSAIRPESPNLAGGQGGGNEPPRQNQKEREADSRFKNGRSWSSPLCGRRAG